MFGPKKRGPKPETFLLKAKAKAKEKTYEFRREAPRGIQVSYPIPEPVITPRAREGLRTVVPTIFPPSAVNRGESVHIRPPESERRPRPTPPAPPTVQESQRFPKKRGRKPKHFAKDDGSSSAQPDAKRSKLIREPMSHHSRPPHHHGETSDHSLMQLTKRFQEETRITPKSNSEQRHLGGAGLSYSCALASDMRSSDQGRHRTHCLSMIPRPSKLKQHAAHDQVKEYSLPREQAAVTSSQIDSIHEQPGSSWTPCFTNLDTVTVTDVTLNFLTVTVRESSTDKGFFKDKR